MSVVPFFSAQFIVKGELFSPPTLSFNMQGLVLKSTGSHYRVSTPNGIIECKLGGRLRLEELKHTNPVSVGDEVIISDQEGNIIIDLVPRKNYLIRKATNLSKQTHIVAANIDQLIIKNMHRHNLT